MYISVFLKIRIIIIHALIELDGKYVVKHEARVPDLLYSSMNFLW